MLWTWPFDTGSRSASATRTSISKLPLARRASPGLKAPSTKVSASRWPASGERERSTSSGPNIKRSIAKFMAFSSVLIRHQMAFGVAQPIMQPRRRHRALPHRDADLVEPRDDIAGSVENGEEAAGKGRTEENKAELKSLMRNPY